MSILIQGFWKMTFWFVLKVEINYRVTSLNPVPNAQVCVYLTVHITKLQLQTTFPKPLYISHSACIHRDPDRWKFCWVCCWYWYQNLRGAPPGVGHAFLRQGHMRKGGLFISAKVFFPVWCHPWMDDEMNGWMDGSRDEKTFTKNDHDVLYYICNNIVKDFGFVWRIYWRLYFCMVK